VRRGRAGARKNCGAETETADGGDAGLDRPSTVIPNRV